MTADDSADNADASVTSSTADTGGAPPFVHLSIHSEYSLVDSIVRIKPLVGRIAATMPAMAITDRSNLFALVKTYRAALAAGVKPIAGVDMRLRCPDDEMHGGVARVLLFAQNETGYRNLTNLVSRGYREGQTDGAPMLEPEWVFEAAEGLIALSGSIEGDVGLAVARGDLPAAEAHAMAWQRHFGDRYYLELTRCRRPGEEAYIAAACAIAIKHGIPVVATNDVRFLDAEDFDVHEARLCIQGGFVLADNRRPKTVTPEQYLKSPEEMAALFADIPAALANTVEIAKRCNLSLTLGNPVLPDFTTPAGQSESDYLIELSQQGLEVRLNELYDITADDFAVVRKPYDERLRVELDVIIQMGFPGYFLIVQDFINWSRNNGIPVGPGRGSGAGSLVAYALRITDLDPLAYDLLFERFLNPERVSMPDFDIDFCINGRDRVIHYVAEKYGSHRVSQIITYGTMAAKAVVRDVGRIMSHPFGFVDSVAKMVPFEVGMTLDKALSESSELAEAYERDEEIRALIDMGKSLEGLARNCGRHAGGVVIAPSALTDFAPLYCEADGSSLVTQFDKDDAEAVGLVKFDFLGLRNLTVIDKALQVINKGREEPLDMLSLPLDDPDTFSLLKRAQTTAVFQLESTGMKGLIEKLLPDNFEDIIALVALFRPGPLDSGMVDDFIDRKHGRTPLAWPHKDYQLDILKPILEPTYGIILYQEQVMGIAQVMAGYSLGAADLLRRAMGKKKPEEMARQRAVFLEGCSRNDIDVDLAGHIFDLVEKFAGYGFNKSHSAAYALVSYQTAWLKTHYPAAFMASVLTSDIDHTDKVVMLIDECKQMGLEVLPPDINRSGTEFTVKDDATIVYGLAAIKGVGAAVLDSVIAEREAGGAYASLEDLCQRAGEVLNRRVLEALVKAGAVDELGPNRASLFAHVPAALQHGDQYRKNNQAGQDDLFGLGGSLPVAGDDAATVADEAAAMTATPVLADWSDRMRLAGEKETLGLYVSGHPVNEYLPELERFTHGNLRALCDKAGSGKASPGGPGGGFRSRGESVIGAGLVMAVQQRDGKGGRTMIVTLDDGTGRVDAVIRGELLETAAERVRRDEVLIVDGEISPDSFTRGYRIAVRDFHDMQTARDRFARRVVLRLEQSRFAPAQVASLAEILKRHRGGRTGVGIAWKNESASARLQLGPRFAVSPSDELLGELCELVGRDAVELQY